MKSDFYFTILCIWLRVLVITGVPERPNGSAFFSKKKITLFFANSKDFMKIYEEESEGMLKSKARMSFAALYPKSFEKQKISSRTFSSSVFTCNQNVNWRKPLCPWHVRRYMLLNR